jgi:hypothetical protein
VEIKKSSKSKALKTNGKIIRKENWYLIGGKLYSPQAAQARSSKRHGCTHVNPILLAKKETKKVCMDQIRSEFR